MVKPRACVNFHNLPPHEAVNPAAEAVPRRDAWVSLSHIGISEKPRDRSCQQFWKNPVPNAGAPSTRTLNDLCSKMRQAKW